MKIRENLPVLAILAGLVSVVLLCTFFFGGYGLMLSASIGAGILSGPADHDPEPEDE